MARWANLWHSLQECKPASYERKRANRLANGASEVITVLEINVEASEDGGGYHILRLVGEVDAYTVGEFREALAAIENVNWLIVDLSEVPFMDSAGLGALIGGIRRVREADGDVAVISTTAALNRLLHTTGFDRIVPVTESLEDALAALGEG